MAARSQSLVEWVNSFEEGECTSLRGLASGALLSRCVKKVLPDLGLGEDNCAQDEWTQVFHALKDFCSCSLENCINQDKLMMGDEEQIARVVVLLLCLAVQRKPNDDVISRITTLEYATQRDIMFYIEETLAKLNTNALSVGSFTSGVGSVVPSLDTEEDKEENLEMCEDSESSDVPLQKQDDVIENSGCGSNVIPTPHRPTGTSRSNLFDGTHQPTVTNQSNRFDQTPGAHPTTKKNQSSLFDKTPSSLHLFHGPQPNKSSYYSGLESPAALIWMQSPALSLSRTVSRQNRPGEPHREELLRLQHQVRVLERSLLNQQKLSMEFHSELCLKEEQCKKLEGTHHRAARLEEQVKELTDVKDEVLEKSTALIKTEKALQRCQREVEELHSQRLRVGQLEEEVATLHHLQAENNQLQERLDSTLSDLLQERSAIAKHQLASDKVAIASRVRESEMETLLQENQVHCTELYETRQHLETTKCELLRLQDSSSEKESRFVDENKTLSLQLETAQGELTAVREECKRGTDQSRSLSQQLSLAEASCHATVEQYQECVAEMERLRARCKIAEMEGGEMKSKITTLSTTLSSLQAEHSKTHNKFEQLKKTQALEGEEMAAMKASLEEDLSRGVSEIRNYRKQLEEKEEELGVMRKERYGMMEEGKRNSAENDVLKEEGQKLRAAGERLREDSERLREEDCRMRAEIDTLREEGQKMKEVGENLMEEVKILKHNEVKFVKDGENLRAEIEILRMESQRLLVDGQKAKEGGENLEREIENLRQNLEFSREIERKLKEEGEKLQEAVKESLKRVQTLEEERDCAKEENGRLRKEGLCFKEEAECWKEERDQVKEENRNLAGENHHLREVSDHLRKEVECFEEDGECLRKENLRLSEERMHLVEEGEHAKRENYRLSEEEEKLNKDNRNLKNREDHLKRTNENLMQENGELKKDNMYLKKQTESLNRDGENLKQENQLLKENEELLTEEQKCEKQENERLTKEKEYLAEEVQRWKIETRCLNEEVVSLRDKIQWLEEEGRGLREEGEVFQQRLVSQIAVVDEKEQILKSERNIFEGRICGLIEEVAEGKRMSEKEEEERKRREEESERERAKMKGEREELMLHMSSLEEEKGRMVEEVERALRERDEQEEEVRRLQGRLGEAEEGRMRADKELEVVTREAEQNLAKIEDKYKTSLSELERGHELYRSEVQLLQSSNKHLQLQLDEAGEEVQVMLEKQTQLCRELCTLQETKDDTMELCRQYEIAYENERERCQNAKDQLREMVQSRNSENGQMISEMNALRKNLSAEKNIKTRLNAESKSLKAQVSYLEQRLKDSGKQHQFQYSSSPRLHTSTREPRSSVRPHTVHTASEQYSSRDPPLFDDSLLTIDALTTTKPHPPLSDYTDSRPSSSSFSLSSASSSAKHRTSSTSSSTFAKPPQRKEVEEEVRGGRENERSRISELRSRNRSLLPHLKSSYAVELQVQPDSPSMSHDRVRSGRDGARKTRNTNKHHLNQPPPQSVRPSNLTEDSRKRSTTFRKTEGDLTFSGSPDPTRRRVSAPPTPQPWGSLSRRHIEEEEEDKGRRMTMLPSMLTRRCLINDEEEEEEEEDWRSDTLARSILSRTQEEEEEEEIRRVTHATRRKWIEEEEEEERRARRTVLATSMLTRRQQQLQEKQEDGRSTIAPRAVKRWQQQLRQDDKSTIKTQQIRNNKDDSYDEDDDENKPGTMFELNFSPPRKSQGLPDRLKQRQKLTAKLVKPAAPSAPPPAAKTVTKCKTKRQPLGARN